MLPLTVEAMALGRSITLARLLGAEELGRAMLLALFVRMIEMVSDFGIDKLLLQSPTGGQHRFLAELHGFMLLRGGLSAVAILALSTVLPILFPTGPETQTYMLLAIIPLLRGVCHLDMNRFERARQHKPKFLVEAGAAVFSLILIWPLTAIFTDHRAMAWILIAHAATVLVLSHLIAYRPYVARFSQLAVNNVWKFGMPLVANSGLLFLVFYADRLIVAEAYGYQVLAMYGVAIQLAMLPAQMIGRAANSHFLPRMRTALGTADYSRTWQTTLLVHGLFATITTAGLFALAPALTELVYGVDFRPDRLLVTALAFAAALRILRTPYSLQAIATGRTADPARANFIRCLTIVPAALCAAAGLPLVTVAALAALGELGATVRAVVLASPSNETLVVEETCA